MYWSPIRARLLVGTLRPAIRAKAVTPVADCRFVPPPYPPRLRGGGYAEGRAHPRSCLAPHKHKRDASLKPGLGVVEELFDRVRIIYGLHSDPSTSPPTFLRPGAGFSACGPIRFGRRSATSLDDNLYSRLGALLASPCDARCGHRWR